MEQPAAELADREPVQILLYFRLANAFLEPIWNRHYVERAQITMAERLCVEGRGRFCDEVGAIRDVAQNHMMQVVTFVTMEPPAGGGSEALHDERVKVLGLVRSLTPACLVRGQFHGYREKDGVAPARHKAHVWHPILGTQSEDDRGRDRSDGRGRV